MHNARMSPNLSPMNCKQFNQPRHTASKLLIFTAFTHVLVTVYWIKQFTKASTYSHEWFSSHVGTYNQPNQDAPTGSKNDFI